MNTSLRKQVGLWRKGALLACGVAAISGCRDDGRFKTYPAGGTVKFADGRPLAGGAILCESPHGLAARGVIGPDGSFQLGTYGVGDGAVEGTHKVAIRPPTADDYNPDAGAPPPPPIDRKFLSMDTSEIEFHVTPAGPNQFPIEVTRPARPQ